jgi:hypothetical protein
MQFYFFLMCALLLRELAFMANDYSDFTMRFP